MKKKNIKNIVVAITGAIIVVLGLSSMVITNRNEYTLIREFGKVSKVIEHEGLSFKIPFIQTANTIPRQTLIYDLEPSDVITKDKKTMISDSYVLWKVSDPLKFAQSLNSSLTNAESRIDTSVYNATKNIISSMSQDEVISSRAGELADKVVEGVSVNLAQYGVEVLSFETKRLDLPQDNKEAVYERMISERNNIAATYTAEGEAEAKVIRNTTDKETAIMLSDAEMQAEILEAEGEAEYMRILSKAYADEKRTEFYSYVRSLDALKESLKGDNKTVVLPADSPIAEIFSGH